MSDGELDTVLQAIDRLILAATPERRTDLNNLWDRYRPTFVLSPDRPGFDTKAGPYGAVIYTNKTLLQIWILGFAAWRAVEAYAGIIHYCATTGTLLDPPSVVALPGQAEGDATFDRT